MSKENLNEEQLKDALADEETAEVVITEPEQEEAVQAQEATEEAAETAAEEVNGEMTEEVPEEASEENADEVITVKGEAPTQEKKPKPKGRVIFSLFITFFCLLILFLSAYGFLVPDKDYSDNESRLLSQAPEITVAGVLDGSFMKKLESYLTDQFPFRNGCIYLKSLFDTVLGKKEENGAYIGKNGFLFEKPTPFDEEKMHKTADGINQFAEKNKDKNIVFALAPNSSFIYAENLPDFLETENQREQIEGFKGLLDEGIIKIDVTEALLEAKKEHQVFYKSDHHWTTRGGFAAFVKIMESFDENIDIGDFEFYTVSNSFEGTLKSKSLSRNTADSLEVCFPKESQGTYFVEFSGEGNKRESLFFKEKLGEKNHYEVFLGGNYAKVTITTTLEGDRKLLVIKDSFANCVIPMLTPYFSKIVVTDPRYMIESMDGIMQEDAFTDILFLYNADTFFEDSTLLPVLAKEN